MKKSLRVEIIKEWLRTCWLFGGIGFILIAIIILTGHVIGVPVSNFDGRPFSLITVPILIACGLFALACEWGLKVYILRALPLIIVSNIAVGIFAFGLCLMLVMVYKHYDFPGTSESLDDFFYLMFVFIAVFAMVALLVTTGFLLWNYYTLVAKSGLNPVLKKHNPLALPFLDLPTTPLCPRCGNYLENEAKLCDACQSPQQPQAALHDPQNQHYYLLHHDYERLGRGSHCTIVFDDRLEGRYSSISQEHAAIYYSKKDNRFYLRDTIRSNNTLLDEHALPALARIPQYEGEERLSEWLPLLSGSKIRLGDVDFLFYASN